MDSLSEQSVVETMDSLSEQSVVETMDSLSEQSVVENSSQNIQQNTPTQPPSDDKLYNLRKEIFKAAMGHQWKQVHDLYKSNKQVQDQKITSANDTVLHVAISGAKQNTILKLLKVIEDENDEGEMRSKILYARNKHGDTPLHLAAALGLEKVCHKIAKMKAEMVTTARNNLQETPLFMAVRHGKKNALFVLEAAIYDSSREKAISKDPTLKNTKLWLTKRDCSHCRRQDGNNILHCTIKGERFDLAYEIIHLYPELVHYVNASGETALHTLANKPSVFESGTRLGFYDTILYYCTITEPLKLKFNDFKAGNLPSVIPKDEIELLPQTYKVCIDLFSLITEFVNCVLGTVDSSLQACKSCLQACKSCCPPDEENQSRARNEDESKTSEDQKQKHEDESKTSEDQKQRWFPPNYEVSFSFSKIIIKLLLVVLGIGLRLQKIEKLKQKQKNAEKIMVDLVDQSKLWEYEGVKGGMKPLDSQSPPSPTLMESPPVTADDDQPEQAAPANSGVEVNQPNQSKGSNLMIAVEKGARDMLKEVLKKFSLEAKNADKKDIIIIGMEEKDATDGSDTASPVLVAAKRGIKEMVQRILHNFPMAILDQDKDDKNIVLLAVEHRQVHVYNFMLDVPTMKEHVFGKVDKEGNSALHLAAMLSHSRPWSIPGAALQMQWESKWYKYMLDSMNQEIFAPINNEGRTAQEVFTESHETLVKDGSTWLTNTSQSCSVVAALVATVAFASASTVPGGVDTSSGFPVLIKKPAFQLFAIASLVALCFSITSLVMFLAILTSRYQVRDFERGLPVKLILGLTSLFMSIASMLVSFCAGDFFVVEKNLKVAAYPIYVVMCFPVTFFAIAQFSLYIDLIKATIKKVPERTEKMQDY